MPVRIHQLVANVVVQRHCGEESPAAPASGARAIPTAEALPSLDNAIAEPALHLPEKDTGGAVDPRLLADKVYRLMRAEMAVVRERQ